MQEAFSGFSPAVQTKLDSISSVCPLLGGNAVFRARSLQATYNDSIYYDDQLLCNQQGVYYRLAQEEQEEEQLIEREMFMVYPNPNAGLLQIEINKIDGLAQFEIVNTLGQSILQWQHSDARQSLDLNKLQISSGMYYIRVKQVDGTSMQQKFIYQKQ